VAPALNEDFSAQIGGPAIKNGQAIAVAKSLSSKPLKLAVAEDVLKLVQPEHRHSVHRVGHVPSLAYRLAMTADGTIDGTIVKRNSHDWDLAAADLILERAGGRLVDAMGDPLLYNRESVKHGVLRAGAGHALDKLRMFMPDDPTG
jgi:myo-inositol-1(or 4)-monophosphatase